MNESGGIDITFFGSDYVPKSSEVDLVSAKTERKILPDAQKRFETTLKNKRWQQVIELEGGGTLPTLDEWVNHRIENNRGTKFFPCFVTDEQGQIYFLKTQVSYDENALKSLANEAKIITEFNKMGYPSPKIYESSVGDDTTLAFIRLAAISPDQGRSASAIDWQVSHARSAIDYIKQMETTDLSALPTGLKNLEAFQKEINITEVMTDFALRAKEYLPENLKQELVDLKESDGEIDQVLVHGDMALKNVVIDKDGGVLPVDLEFAKKGFLGQDAGKLLTGLLSNPEVFTAALVKYVDNGNGGIDEKRARALMVGMVTENLVHLVWRVEHSDLNDITTQTELKTFVNNIKNVLGIRNRIQEILKF